MRRTCAHASSSRWCRAAIVEAMRSTPTVLLRATGAGKRRTPEGKVHVAAAQPSSRSGRALSKHAVAAARWLAWSAAMTGSVTPPEFASSCSASNSGSVSVSITAKALVRAAVPSRAVAGVGGCEGQRDSTRASASSEERTASRSGTEQPIQGSGPAITSPATRRMRFRFKRLEGNALSVRGPPEPERPR